jgi:hypothetical protein
VQSGMEATLESQCFTAEGGVGALGEQNQGQGGKTTGWALERTQTIEDK